MRPTSDADAQRDGNRRPAPGNCISVGTMQGITRSQGPHSGWPEPFLWPLGFARTLLAGALLLTLVAGCDGGDDVAPGDTTRGTARADAAGVVRESASGSDAAILASFDAANVSDSATGTIAAAKATSSDLRAFAAQMVRDHHAMRLEGERVARRLRLTPEPNAGASGDSGMAATLSLLNATPRGRDFDKAYIDHEVEFHLDFLETVTAAMDRAGETEVRAFIQKLAPMLQEHFDRARELQGRLR